MNNSPFCLCAVISVSVSQTERIDLLFEDFQRILVIVAHAQILSHFFIFNCGDEKATSETVRETSSDIFCITLVGFNSFADRTEHRGGSEDNALDPVLSELMVKCIPKTAGFVGADESAVFSALLFEHVDVFDDLLIVWLCVRIGKDLILPGSVRFESAESETGAMDIHADIGYSTH